MKLTNYQTKSTDKRDFKEMQNPIESSSPFKRLWLLVKYSDTRLLEVFLGVFCLFWGLYILIPVDSFNNTPAFSYLVNILPEWTLGITMFAAGIFTVLFAVSSFSLGRKCVLLANHLMWTFLAVVAVLGNYTSPAVCTYSVISAALMYLFFRSPIRRIK